MKRFSRSSLTTMAVCLLFIPALLKAQPRPAHRKKVGVVLSGGGAKGMAHIGVLKVIEKAGIPIDYVVGTSMGSIIGGLYSIGYSPEQLDSMVRRQDWTFLLSDKIPRSEQNLSERDASQKYVFSIPFGKGVKAEVFGGLIRGQNLANLFSELTIGYHDSINFNKLPIPFACVSENIVNGNEVNFHEGVLATAMRASMAIPGVFTPVRLDSMVLVDGGVVNNYPVNVARAMGADLIIGVDVQSELKPAGELNSAGAILGQLVNLMGQDLYKKNLKETTTYIKVNVEGYSAASFTPSAIDTLIMRGEEAAMAQDSALMALKSQLGLDSTYMPQPIPSYPYSPERKVYVKEITFDGLDEKDKKWLLKRCDLKENSEISIRRIEEATAILSANLGYSGATYNLPEAPGGGYNLNYTLSKKYENKLNVGIRFDSEEIASLLINVTSNFKGKLPSTLSLTGRLGKRYTAGINYAWEPAPLKRVGLSYLFQYNDVNFYHYGDRTHNSTFKTVSDYLILKVSARAEKSVPLTGATTNFQSSEVVILLLRQSPPRMLCTIGECPSPPKNFGNVQNSGGEGHSPIFGMILGQLSLRWLVNPVEPQAQRPIGLYLKQWPTKYAGLVGGELGAEGVDGIGNVTLSMGENSTFYFFSRRALNSSLSGSTVWYLLANIGLDSSGSVISTRASFLSLQRTIPMVLFSSGSFTHRS